MPGWINPFKQHDRRDFLDVSIPLSEAHRDSQQPRTKGGDPVPTLDGIISAENGTTLPPEPNILTFEALRAEVENDLAVSGHDTAYDRKSKVINRAIQDIGMGRYQWELFVLCGFGWLADNLWLQGVALTLPQLSLEFGISESHVRFTTCALFVGLCIGASFWGIASDLIGRRLAFNMTLFLAGVFGTAVGGSPTWIGVCAMYSAMAMGVGGNLPVDGALFLEFLPFASGNLLTMLSVWWPVGQLIGSLFAWVYIPNFTCVSGLPSCSVTNVAPCCKREDNMGWRYLVFTLGCLTLLMFACRFFLFHLHESPKFLLSRGRQEDAVATVHAIASKNGAKTWLTVDILNKIGGYPEEVPNQTLSSTDIVRRAFSKFSTQRIGPLFATKRLGLTTIILWFCWATIGMGYPLFNAFLPQYLSHAGASGGATPVNITYRNYAITSIVGVPGSIIACFTVDVKYVGRKGTIAISTLITGIILFCFTVSTNPNVQLVCASLEAFFQNIMYGVLYAYTPEVFPAPNRGTGTGIASFFNRICGLMAPIVAIYGGNTNPNVPVYIASGLILAAFVAMCLLPIETRGKQTL
ncbi:hypothetical protein Egran_02153 [Elaphomyces granulatus]|uniref:Major facilitator superfamily (MFS) profile domain-containing protein n=1 Tax=Elaphomyces granulatus TaxID=519963 RepID=A0A232M0Z6_9EURO|nr:hypothetical protein Egran_02153 [Elaphomyces granulatus]